MMTVFHHKSGLTGAFCVGTLFLMAVVCCAAERWGRVRCEGRLRIDGLPASDTCYDWGGHAIVEKGVHHLWWTRYSTVDGEFDTIWHATGSDGLHWRHVQKVLTPANSAQEKMHVADPSVVKVGPTFYMFYEANRRVTTKACESQIFLATSSDGVKWAKHPSDTDPRPVVALGEAAGCGKYGIGMPSVHYRNGAFHMYYLTSLGSLDTIRYARTKDPFRWGNWKDHAIVAYGAGFDVKYNKTLKCYLMSYSVLSDLTPDPAGVTTYEIHVFRSADGRTWNGRQKPRLWEISSDRSDLTTRAGFSQPRTRAFPTLAATDAQGCMKGASMRLIFMEGEMHPIPGDWKVTARTWDLHSLTFSIAALGGHP